MASASNKMSLVFQYLLYLLLFLDSRYFVFCNSLPQHSDVNFYSRYVQAFELARARGISFYDMNEQIVRKQRAGSFSSRAVSISEEYEKVAYPPLAIAVILLPAYFFERLPADGSFPAVLFEHYHQAYQIEMCVFDSVLFLCLILLVKRLFPLETATSHLERLAVYLLGTTVLWPLLYDRLEIVTAAMIIVSVLFLLFQKGLLLSFATLALAINFKITPIALVPVWIISSFRCREFFHAPTNLPLFRLSIVFLYRLLLLGGLTCSIFLPFFLWQGKQTLDFLAFHEKRGIEIESFYSSLMMVLSAFGLTLNVYNGFGSTNLGSSIAETLANAAPWIFALLMVPSMALFTAACWRLLHRMRFPGNVAGSIANLFPLTIVSYCLLFLLIPVVTNKVFSGHYLFWVLPLACLAPFAPLPRRLIMWSFVFICFLTTLIYPFLWGELAKAQGPTLLGAWVLGVRNSLVLCLTIFVATALWKHYQISGEHKPTSRFAN